MLQLSVNDIRECVPREGTGTSNARKTVLWTVFSGSSARKTLRWRVFSGSSARKTLQWRVFSENGPAGPCRTGRQTPVDGAGRPLGTGNRGQGTGNREQGTGTVAAARSDESIGTESATAAFPVPSASVLRIPQYHRTLSCNSQCDEKCVLA